MEEKDDKTCGREGDRHPFTQTNLQDEFIPPILLVLTYILTQFDLYLTLTVRALPYV